MSNNNFRHTWVKMALLAAWVATLSSLPLTFAAAAEKQPAAAAPRPMSPTLRVPPEQRMILASPAPNNVTLTPVSATNIRIEWSPAPGAVRYVISRNGAADVSIDANAGYLQGNRYLYTDVGRKPATLHTYSVTAQFPAPTLPGRSAPVQVLTPSALAPQNFKASVSGPGAVTLTWTGRPEATGYRLYRSGPTLPATALNATGLNYVDQNLPAGEYTYTVFSVVRLATGEELQGEFSTPVTVRTRPFNVLAIGDSVMWGQGLLPANKFATKIRDWIAAELRKDVRLKMSAHSGAITYPNPGDPVYENRSYHGEVPADWPTISHQISLASSASISGQPPARDVDLVLIDGCANNLGILTVLNPIPVPGQTDEDLRNDTRAYCGAGMTNILGEVVQKFPNADVIVTGYFPYVSKESELAALIPVFAIISVFIPPDPLIGGIAVTAGYRERAAARSDLFFQESNSSLQAAVNTVNSSQFPGRTKFNQIRYARLNAGPHNSYAAPSSWQFLIPAPPFAQDEVYEERRAQCYKVLQEAGGNPNLMPGENIRCIQASMGHPNAAGAQGYTNAIKSVAAQFVTSWRTAHLATTARDDSVVVRVQPGTTDSSGGTMVVTATDGPSGAPLAGTILLNGVPAGALGTPVRYVYAQSNPADIVASLSIPGRQPRQFLIPRRTFSVAVNLTNNGDPRTALVTATDTATGQLLSGTVTIRSDYATSVSAQTGQSLTYPSCGTAAPTYRPTTRPAGLTPCFGTVRVPFYPEVAYQDVPGTATLKLQPTAQP